MLTVDLLVDRYRPEELEVAPRGDRVAFALTSVMAGEGGSHPAGLWVGAIDGQLSPISETRGAKTPRFSWDGSQLAFACDVEQRGRLGLSIVGRGQIGSFTGSVEDIRWSRDDRRLLVLVADASSDRASVQAAVNSRNSGADDPQIHRPAQYWRRLILVNAASGETRDVTPPGVNVYEFGWVGGSVVAVCTDEPSEGAWYDAWIGLIDIETQSVERVHTPTWQLQCPRISPQGRVAWIEGLASDRTAVSGVINVLGLGPIAPELDATSLGFLDETTLWYAGWRGAETIFGRVDLDGSTNQLYSGRALVGGRYQPRIAPSADGTTVAAVLEAPDRAPEVVLFEDGKPRALTSFNSGLAPHLHVAEWRHYSWHSFDGSEIDGLLALPTTAWSRPLPLVVFVHGGPAFNWPWMLHEQPLLLAQDGYAALLPNPRGSAGRGQEFARANLGDLGGADLKDILAGVDALVLDGMVDTNRVAITGRSYGGFMATWAITQTNRFAAAIPCGVHTNWVSFHLTTNIPRFDRLFMRDDPFDPNGDYVTRSPVYHARSCTTPTLLLHGELDSCTPVSQAVEFYNALNEAGCPSELVVYPREGHLFSEREHQLDAWARTRAWLERHLRIE